MATVLSGVSLPRSRELVPRAGGLGPRAGGLAVGGRAAPVLYLRLSAFLDRLEGGPPPENCMIPLADWAMILTGVDPAADLRGRYPWSSEGWQALGPLPELLRCIAGAAGLVEVTGDQVAPGDVAIVEVPGVGPMGAIAEDHRRWFVCCRDGTLCYRFRRVGPAWRVSCPRR